jgi:hypothetical protein
MVRMLASMYEPEQLSKIKVLDWGAGRGHNTYLMKKAGFDVVSCDVQSNEDDGVINQEMPIIDQKGLDFIALTHPWELPFPDVDSLNKWTWIS